MNQENTTNKVTIILMSGVSDLESKGRALHAMLYAKQAEDAGLDAELLFDGAGVEWAGKLMENPEDLEELYTDLRDRGVIAGVCQFCSGVFKVEDKTGDLPHLNDQDGHPDIGKRIASGRHVITI